MKNKLIKTVFSRRMLVSFVMGFACGLPLLLTISLLQAWMKDEGVDLTVIGLMALVGLPYTVKFLWAPFLDRITLPWYDRTGTESLDGGFCSISRDIFQCVTGHCGGCIQERGPG